jgi:hypothetical protein
MLTMPYWEDLARASGVRLPYQSTKLTTGGVAKFLHRLDLSVGTFCKWMGHPNLKAVVEANSWFSLREFCGLVLEYREEVQRANQGVNSLARSTASA